MEGPEEKYAPEDEKALLSKIAAGDWNAYNQLVASYYPQLQYYLMPLVNNNRQDMEDIVQDVFISLWEKRESLVAIRSLKHYLFRMTRNRFLDFHRRENSRQHITENFKTVVRHYNPAPDEQTVYSEYLAEAAKIIEALSPKLRTVFLLSTQEDLSLDEIADYLQLPKETVKKRLYLASRSVRTQLSKRSGQNFFSFFFSF